MNNCMDNYIVRIYRREGKGSRTIIGVVEQVGAKGRLAFQDMDELWAILNERKGRMCKRKEKSPLSPLDIKGSEGTT